MDDAGDDAAVDPVTPDTSTTGPEDTGSGPEDAGAGVACDGLAEWSAGTTAPEVKHFGEKYTCLVEGWCCQSSSAGVAAYEPGKGWAWTQAWQDSGPCPAAVTDAGALVDP